MNVKALFRTVVVLGPLLAAGSPAYAQPQIELAPYAGLFAPFGDPFTFTTPERVFDPVIGGEPDTMPEERDIASHEPALAVGARLTVWLSRRFGLQASLLYTESRLTRRTEREGELFGFPPTSTTSELVSVTARGVFRLGTPDAPISFRLFSGAGILTRGGRAYTNLESTSDPSVVAGGGLRVEVAPGVALLVEVEDQVSWASFDLPGSRPQGDAGLLATLDEDTRIQNHLVISQAVSISLN